MKKYSKIGVLLRHPLKTIITWCFVLFWFTILQLVIGIDLFANGDDVNNIILALTFFVALCITQRHYNKEEIRPVQPKRKKRRGLLSFIWSSAVAVDRACDRRQRAMGEAFVGAFTGSFAPNRADEERRRAARRQANADACARYDAWNNFKKAEYDARDAALRGKDKAAYHYQNQANNWYKQSKR